MTLQDELALASRPDLFQTVPSARLAKNGRILAWTQPVLFLLVAAWFLTRGSTGYLVIGLILVVAGAVGFFTMRKWAGDAKEWALRDGRGLNSRKLPLREDAEEAWRRLATGDVLYYTPLKVEERPNGNALHQLHLYWPTDGERVTYLAITPKIAKDAAPPDVLELRDHKHDQFHAALEHGLFKKFSA